MAVAWLASMLAASAPALAQTQAQPPARAQAQDATPDVARDGARRGRGDGPMDGRLDAAEAKLRAVRIAARPRTLSDEALKAQLDAIPPLQDELADILSSLTPRLEDTQARLAELGPPPAAGQVEAPDVATNRARLTRNQQNLDGATKRARLLSVEAGQLADALTGRLRQNFSTRLQVRSRSALEPALWGEAAANLPGDIMRFGAAVTDQAGSGRGSVVDALVFLAIALVLLGPVRILWARLGWRWATTIAPSSSLRKSALALWLTLVGSLTPLFAAMALRRAAAPATADMEGLFAAFVTSVFFAALIDALGRSLLAPGRPTWRLAPMSDAVVERLRLYPTAIGVVVGVASFISRANDLLEVSAPTAVAGDCLAVLIELAAVGSGLMMLGRARGERAAMAEDDEPPARSRALWVLAAVAAWLALAATLVALIAGYLALATFIMRELIWIALVLASLFLLLRFVDDLCQALFSAHTRLGRLIQTAVGLSDETLEQLGVLLSGLLRLGLLMFGWVAIIAPFGASAQEIVGRATSAEMVFKLGQLSISPGLIFGGLLVFFIGLAVTRLIRGWLETTYLPKTRIDLGVRTSITAGLTYLGALVAVLMTCAYLGLSLDKIALFASALSVGIGFGLQAVIGNFVSGLILLAERPVKVGDWIAIGDQEGDVKRINIRATEIEMGDRSKLIVPNSDLISKTVRNVTRGDALGQVKIMLKVANDADPAKVRELLLGRLAAHGEVVREPAPGVYLTGLPDGAFEFTCIAAVPTARHAFRIKSELLFAMVAGLKAEGVRLASSSTVIQLTDKAAPQEAGR